MCGEGGEADQSQDTLGAVTAKVIAAALPLCSQKGINRLSSQDSNPDLPRTVDEKTSGNADIALPEIACDLCSVVYSR